MEYLVDVSMTAALRVQADSLQDLIDKLSQIEAVEPEVDLGAGVVLHEVSLGMVRPQIAVVAEVLDAAGADLALPEQPVLDAQLPDYMSLPAPVA